MSYPAHGTRRVRGIALLWCALLLGAAETGGAIAPPCAVASPVITPSVGGAKPVGDPDTPDEGGHQNSTTSVIGASVAPAVVPYTSPATRRARFDFVGWLRALLGFFH